MIARSALLDDVTIIQRLYDAVVKDPIGVYYTINDWPLYIDNVRSRLLVVEHQQQVVGFLLGFDCVNWFYIDVMIVDPNFRGLGVGTALLHHIEQLNNCWRCIELCTDQHDDELQQYLVKRRFRHTGNAAWMVMATQHNPGERPV